MTLDDHKVDQKQKVFRGFALDYLWPLSRIGKNARTPQKIFLSENVIFWGLIDI